MATYPLMTFRLPVETDAKQVRAAFANVAKEHGYVSDYHVNNSAGSPGLLILAINAGEAIVCPFDDEWYSLALAGLATFAGEGWADALAGAIEAAQRRGVEDIWDEV